MEKTRASSVSRSAPKNVNNNNATSSRAGLAQPSAAATKITKPNFSKETKPNPTMCKNSLINEIKKQLVEPMCPMSTTSVKKIKPPSISCEPQMNEIHAKNVFRSKPQYVCSDEASGGGDSFFGVKKNLAKPCDTAVEKIKRRLSALKLLQIKSAQLEAKYYEELYLLECKYNDHCGPLKELRKKIVNGEHEPSDEECRLQFVNSDGDLIDLSLCNDEVAREKEISRDLLALSISNKNQAVKGVPEFWLSVLKKVELVNQMIEEYDEPILKHLIDIDIDLIDKKPYNFTLKFQFAPNEYFHEAMLTKTYLFKIDIDSSEPFVFEAPETQRSIGCKISWKKGKNVTRKLVERKQAAPNNKVTQVIEEKQVSFFNFFITSEAESKTRPGLSGEEEAELAFDYEIGYTFKEKIIPRAILYFMGEISDENSEFDDDEDESEDEFEGAELLSDCEDTYSASALSKLKFKNYQGQHEINENSNNHEKY